jgi:hypothetical protein
LLLFLVLNLPLEAFSFHAARYCLHKCCTSELFFRSGFHFNYLTIIFTICHLFGIACQTKLYIYIGWNGFFFVNFLYFVVHRGFLFFSIKLIVFIWWFLYTVCHCRDKLLARNGYIARVCWQMLVSFFFFFPILIFAMETLFCNYGCCDLIENNKLETFLIYLFIYLGFYLLKIWTNSCINLAGVFVLHSNLSFLLRKLFPCTLMCKRFSQLCHQDRFCSFLVLWKRKVVFYHSFK